ncbi:DegT/DnrJ/EryC1/StrS aminotransferase family protein [Synechococcus sp. GEYO]|uniref:DegT/DnrJ/EryC1/StrS family aminotransferase n=1 Tax=Synechococcus sp. GEYO TaxID=2575511 RepID=UPI000E0E4AA8|nr:DegT/DnrJ/EryC1/StrS family aminotransferase [Synechococcus sp. GEYO]
MPAADALAINGGTPVISKTFPPYRSLGEEEIAAANRVLRSGVLSAFIGASGPGFYGGPEVQALEREAAERFDVKHVVSVNSWTSGLVAAMGAIGLEPGDEVIVTPWTMVATATAILHWNAIPVFADIDPQTFNIDPEAVEAAITPRTRAIAAVDIFGQSADIPALRAIADRNGCKLVTDTAQAPGALLNGIPAGTAADIGGFSLNYHKHIHCGEGGLLVTNDDRLAERLRLIRNHGEAVIASDQCEDLANILGHNFRLGEIEAAIAREQLPKLSGLIKSRQQAAARLTKALSCLPGLNPPKVRPDSTHVYYIYGMTIDLERLRRDRDWIVKALKAEGVSGLLEGYQNIHLNPLFRHRIAYGTSGFPWTGLRSGDSDISYGPGLCPVAEQLHQQTFIGLNLCAHAFTDDQVDAVIYAFKKVWADLSKVALR